MNFNLCDDPWIPIVGSRSKKSLTDIFSDLSLPHLSGDPVEKIVMLRFLLCVVHASCKIPDLETWRALTNEKISEQVLAYLKRTHDCFYLYGERPFLQFPQLEKIGGSATPLGSLMVNVSEGNKVVFSGWNQYRALSDAERVLLLLRSSCFACGGKKYDHSLVLSRDIEKGKTGQGGTLLGLRGYLHVFLRGEKLLDTLRLNLLTDEEIKSINVWSSGLGIPFWECMPEGENDARAKSYRNSYLGQLFPLDKFLLLQEEGIIKTTGIPYATPAEGGIDPALTIIRTTKDVKALNASTTKRPWRELPSILAFLKMNNGCGSPYFLSFGLKKLRLNNPEYVSIWTGGLEVSANSGEQYVSGKNDYVESMFSLPTAFMRDDHYPKLQDMLSAMELESKRLYGCVFAYYREMKSDDGPAQASHAATIYWEQLEPRAQGVFNLAFSNASAEELEEEKKQWFKIICRIFDEICPRETPRQLMAWVNAHPGFSKKQNNKEEK